MQLLATDNLQRGQASFHLPSERFNTQATHIQCSSPSTSGYPALLPTDSLRTGWKRDCFRVCQSLL